MPRPAGGRLGPPYALGSPLAEARLRELRESRGALQGQARRSCPWFSHRVGELCCLRRAWGATRLRPAGNYCRGWGSQPPPSEEAPDPQEGPGTRLTTLGLKGGWISRFSSFSSRSSGRRAASRTSRSPSGPQPSRSGAWSSARGGRKEALSGTGQRRGCRAQSRTVCRNPLIAEPERSCQKR